MPTLAKVLISRRRRPLRLGRTPTRLRSMPATPMGARRRSATSRRPRATPEPAPQNLRHPICRGMSHCRSPLLAWPRRGVRADLESSGHCDAYQCRALWGPACPQGAADRTEQPSNVFSRAGRVRGSATPFRRRRRRCCRPAACPPVLYRLACGFRLATDEFRYLRNGPRVLPALVRSPPLVCPPRAGVMARAILPVACKRRIFSL